MRVVYQRFSLTYWLADFLSRDALVFSAKRGIAIVVCLCVSL